MKDMVESLISIIEFLIQGSLAAAVALYLAAFFHPVPERLRKYFTDLRSTLSGQNTETGSVNSLVVALALAALYFLGVVSNIVNYWALVPVHNLVIQEVHDEKFKRLGDAAFLKQAFPLLLTRDNPSQKKYYEDYLAADATWRNTKLEALESILPNLKKYIRIIRGVVVASYVVFFIALLKSIVGLLILIACARGKGTPNSVAAWLFRHFVSYTAYEQGNKGLEVSSVVSETRKRMVAPNVILATLGIVAFSIALLSYRTIEQEYQLLNKYGASPQANKSSDPTAP